jgi:hypothetical protein
MLDVADDSDPSWKLSLKPAFNGSQYLNPALIWGDAPYRHRNSTSGGGFDPNSILVFFHFLFPTCPSLSLRRG